MACLFAPAPAPAATALAQEAEAPSMAVVFPDRGVLVKGARLYDGLSKAVSALVSAELGANYGVRLVDRERVRPLAGTVPIDRATAIRIGTMTGAQHILYGGVSADDEGNLRVDVHAVNVATGAVEYTDRVQDRAEQVVPLVHRLAARLATAMRLAPLSPGHVAPILPESLPLKDVLLYGRALDLADHGDRAAAAAAFNSLLADYPAFALARADLSRLR